MKRILLSSLLFAATIPALFAADTRTEIETRPERAGGIYYAYPTDEITVGRKPPKGYEPFYVSHYGRHGSRYLISDKDYQRLIDRLADAHAHGALTAAGEQLRLQLDTIWVEAHGRGGELTPLGSRQHRGIAHRLAADYPAVFADGAEVAAASTPVMRCAHSMFAFIEGLKELNPTLQVPRESAERNMWYLNYHSKESGPYSSHNGPWYQDYKRFEAEKTQPERLMSAIFSDKNYVDTWVDQPGFMWDLYWLAVDMQNMETAIDLLPYFTTDELYDMWQMGNFSFYATNSSYPRAEGKHTDNARNLVGHILDNADSYIAGGKHGATLRFGHDGNIIPLTALLRLEGCYSDAVAPADLAKDYANYRISPMASNLQLIFFKNKKNAADILVRVMLNERDINIPVTPTVVDGVTYYSWSDLRPYLSDIAHPASNTAK